MKTFAKISLPLLLVAIVFILNNCNRKVTEQAVNRIAPPFEKVDVAYHETVIDAATGGEIKFNNGTKIQIPANAFTDEDGNPLNSKVKIQFREFHNSNDVLLSGIPMKYQGENFQTAGMFEIKGNTEDGSMVKISQGKSVNVQLASYMPGNDYDFYYYDEQKNEWVKKGTSSAVPNPDFQNTLEDTLAPVKPLVAPGKPVKQTSDFVFDLEINNNTYPELSDFDGVVWQYAGDGTNNPEKSPWVFTEKWTYVKLDKAENAEMKYVLSLSNKEKQYSTTVSPVLSGKNYKRAVALFEKRMAEYQNALAAKEQLAMQQSREASLTRSFSVNNFGIYNWDRFYKNENMILCNADFRLDKKVAGVDMDNITVYLLTANNTAVIPYGPSSKSMFSFDPYDVNKLIAVLPGDKIAVFGNEDFKNLSARVDLKTFKNHTFVLRVLDQKVVTPDNLNNMLASI